MTRETVIGLIEFLGFKATIENKDYYLRTFTAFDYNLIVDLLKFKIDFGDKIVRGDNTTSHLQNPENLVVLECVCRLLEKGYKPEDLTLENRWKMGRTTKGGKADITVKGKDGKTLIIIECKTWSAEYEKELGYMKINGGQLFSYFQQDKNARYLCLYSSDLIENSIKYKNAIINVEDSTAEKLMQQEREDVITYDRAKTVKELHEVWKIKSNGKAEYIETGIFESEIEPYNPGYIPIKIKDLIPFGKEDKGKVFNEFEEILRHNNISDRSNAFNRIISLILAKIVDETKNEDEIADFQLKVGIDDAETLLERLQTLYSKAMKDYLLEEVIDYKLQDIQKEIENFPKQASKDNLYRIYKELKFYQNNEFAFKEVYNKQLFEENSKVLEEVVKLFQSFRFKYERKAQFLGDFFEVMLETGYKQSEGQFFTPTPIARFIVSSIPIETIIVEKIETKESKILPYIIDFACGSGHFLTEAMEEIIDTMQTLLTKFPNSKELADLQDSTKWAKDFIFGIEKDYRLARTSQVACFMHGDGDANIIFGDGLLKHDRIPKDGSFNILIANPPYTIDNFKPHLRINPVDFELWEHIPDSSDDIEVLFIERMKQLLKPGGFGSIILPHSILNSGGVYIEARKLILKFFEIVSIVELGNKTFGETGNKTCILFLKRRSDDVEKNCRYIAEDFILKNSNRNFDFVKSNEILDSYIEILGLDVHDFRSLLNRAPSDGIMETEYYKEYKIWFEKLPEIKTLKTKKFFLDLTNEEQVKYLDNIFFDYLLNSEFDKFYNFLLCHSISEKNADIEVFSDEDGNEIVQSVKHFLPQNIVIVDIGKSDSEQKDFLGYKFSKRRGEKGIDISPENSLFDPSKKANIRKVNYYIYDNYLNNEPLSIDDALTKNLSYISLSDCIDFGKIDFDVSLNTTGIVKIDYEKVWQSSALQNLKQIAEITKGTSITKAKTIEGEIPVVAGGQEPAYYHNSYNRKGNIITVSGSGAYAGFVNYWGKPIFASDCSTIKSLDEDLFPTRLIYHYLKHIQKELYLLQRGSSQPHVYPKDLKKIMLPKIEKDQAAKKLSAIDNILNNRTNYLKPDVKTKDIDSIIDAEIGKLLTN